MAPVHSFAQTAPPAAHRSFKALFDMNVQSSISIVLSSAPNPAPIRAVLLMKIQLLIAILELTARTPAPSASINPSET